MDSGQDNNNNGNKVANDDFLLEEFNKDDNVQFTLFKLQVVLANSWFLGNSLYAYKTKVSDVRTTLSSHNHIESGSYLYKYHANKREKEWKTKNSWYILYKKSNC